MFDEYELAICTLKKVAFFNSAQKYNLSEKDLIKLIMHNTKLSQSESFDHLYSKATEYNRADSSKDEFIDFILS